MPNELEYIYFTLMDTLRQFAWYVAVVAVLLHLCWAISLWTIARRRELKGRWTAWVPFLNMWLLGSIADQYRYVVKGNVTCSRGGLLWVTLLEKSALVVLLVAAVMEAGEVAAALEDELPLLGVLWIPVKFLKPNVQLLGAYLIARILLVEYRTMVLHDVYRSCDPEKTVINTILSVLPVAGIFLRPLRLRSCRRCDDGMPPRWDELPLDELEWYCAE